MPSRGQQLGKLLNPTGDIVETSLPPKIETFSQSVSNTGKVEKAALGNDVSTIEEVSDVSLLTASGNSVGDQRVVGNNLYIWNGSGWFRIALINETPTWNSGGQPAGAYVLDADSPQTATSITLAASDPDGLPISYSYVTGGSMDSIATISQDSSVFTITPKTLVQAPDGGTGSITFRATDGINILPQVSSFTLSFITAIENSNHTIMHVNAIAASDNNNITDASSNSHSITVNGDAHAGTFSPYRRGGYAMSFNGTNESFEPNHSSASGLGTTWSFSFWANIPTSGVTNNSPYVVDFYRSGGGDDSFAMQVFTSTKKIELTTRVWGAGGGYGLATATNLTCFDKWSYYVVSHSSGTTTLYIDGSSAGTSTGSAFSSIEAVSVQNLMLGARNTGSSSEFAKVDIRDFHLKSEVHNGAVNNEPAVADSNTIILAAHKPYLAAQTGASTALAPVINNSVSIKPFSPYDYLEYSATDHGGSVYFDGTGDSLVTSAIIPATGNFTLEGWVYSTSTDTSQIICGQRTNSGSGRFAIAVDAGNIEFFQEGAGSGEYNTSNLEALNKWCHFVLMRTSNNLALYVNGERKLNTTSGTFEQTNFEVGTDAELDSIGLNQGLYGFVSDLRVSLSAKYSEGTSVAVPTAPLSSSGAELHIKGTDASIIDKSQGTNLKLEGNTTGSTTQVKFADTKSMYFDGSGDYLETNTNLHGNFGIGDYTVEAWVYLDVAIGSNRAIFGSGINDASDEFTLLLLASGLIYFDWNGSTDYIQQSSSTFTAYTWHHIAITRSGTQLDVWLDGVSVASSSSHSFNYTGTSTFKVGMARVGSFYWNGYIQDVRLTNGLARYTANFTPPTTPLEG